MSSLYTYTCCLLCVDGDFSVMVFLGSAEAFSSSAVTRIVLPKATQDVFPVMSFNTVISSDFVIPTLAPVALQSSVPVMLKQSPVYLTHLMMCKMVLPYLDSFEVVLTTTGFSANRNFNSEIAAWFHG